MVGVRADRNALDLREQGEAATTLHHLWSDWFHTAPGDCIEQDQITLQRVVKPLIFLQKKRTACAYNQPNHIRACYAPLMLPPMKTHHVRIPT